MKYLWLIGIISLYPMFYIYSFMGFMQGLDLIAWPMILGGGWAVGMITWAYFKEYWLI